MTGSSPERIGMVSHIRVNSSPHSRILAGNDLVDQPIKGLRSPEACRLECEETYKESNAASNHVLYGQLSFSIACRAFIYRTDYDDCWPKSIAGDPTPCSNCVGKNYDEQVLQFVDCTVVLNL